MKRIFLVFGTALVHTFCFCQTDSSSAEGKIMAYKPEYPQVIANGRAMLADLFPSGEKEQITEVINYLMNDFEKKGYSAFSSYEKIILCTWISDYSRLLLEVGQVVENDFRRYTPYSRYHLYDYDPWRREEDVLADVITVASIESLDSLLSNIRASELQGDQKDFLCLYLEWTLKVKGDSTVSDSLSRDAKVFLRDHPDSEFQDYVRVNLLHLPKHPNFGFGFEFFPAGVAVLSGELSDHFKNRYGLGFGFDVYYKRLVTSVKLAGYYGKTKVDIPVSGDSLMWKKGFRSATALFDGSVGYAVVNKEAIALTPFVGMAYTDFTPGDKDAEDHPELEDFILYSHAYMFGFNLDWMSKANRYSYRHNYWFVRLRYSCYLPQLEKKYDDYGGIINTISVGVGVVRRPVPKQLFQL